MSTYAAPIDVKRAAMIRAGIKPISTDTDPGWRATVAADVYEAEVEAALTTAWWKFAKGFVQLTRPTDEQDFGQWRYAWAEPFPDPKKLANRGLIYASELNSVTDFSRARQIEHEIIDGVIYTNFRPDQTTDTLVLLYTERAPEGEWSPRFAAAFVKYLAGVFTAAIKKDLVGGESLKMRAHQDLLAAAVHEAEQDSRERKHDPALVNAWSLGVRRFN